MILFQWFLLLAFGTCSFSAGEVRANPDAGIVEVHLTYKCQQGERIVLMPATYQFPYFISHGAGYLFAGLP